MTSGLFRSFVTLWLVALASVPLSLRWTVSSGGTVMAVPLESLVAACAVVLVVAWAFGRGPEFSLLLHPVSLAVFAGLAWTLVTTMISIDPLVSMKYALARTAYVVTFFVGGLLIMSRLRTRGVVAAGLAGFLPVVAWTVWRHAPTGFIHETSIEVGAPFYPNHLEYGATLAFWMLVLVGLAMADRAKKGRIGGAVGILTLGFLPLLWAAHSRSAWLALIAGFAVIVLQRIGVGLRGVMIAGTLVLVAFFGLFAVYFTGEWPDTEAVAGEGVQEPGPFEDPSINERLNRWSCAVRMAEERPLVGFGPGTYEESYGLFQLHGEMTSHSSLRGDRGDAHSEFFSCLAEQGVVGLMLVAVLFGVAVASGLRAVDGCRDESQRWKVLGWTSAVASLVVGNLFNAFFEVDRVAPLLWLACAAVVVMERNCATTRPENR